MAKTKTISVTFRCPEYLYNALSNFALDHTIIKDDKPIISEALIAALRIGLGTDSNTDVSQSVRQPDFEAMITEAIAPLFARLETLEAISREATPSEKKPLIQANLIENDALPIIEAIANIADTVIEKSLDSNALSEAIASTDILLLNRKKLCERLKLNYKNLSTNAGKQNMTTDSFMLHTAKQKGEIWEKAESNGREALWQLVKTSTP